MARKAFSIACAWVMLFPTLALAAPRARDEARDDRLTVDLYQADVRNVLRLLADVGGVNMVIANEVNGTISVKLRDVAWREALDVVLTLNGLEAEQRGRVIVVASAETFAKQRASRLTRREQCLASAPLRTRIVRVSYANAAEVAAHIRPTLTSRGSVSVDTRTNSLIVRDVVCE